MTPWRAPCRKLRSKATRRRPRPSGPYAGSESTLSPICRLLEEAAIPLPSLAQISLWAKTVGGIEPLLKLLRRLINAGLANKRNPSAYVHRVILVQAAHPEPVVQYEPRHHINPVFMAGLDETRREQARRIIASAKSQF